MAKTKRKSAKKSSSSPARAHWSGRMAFVLAAAGSAIGLGNIWKFPYVTGVNGGGAFVLIYILCILVVGIPILVAELYVGQQSQRNTVGAFDVVHRKGSPWKGIGYLGLLSAVLILSFYSVVGGWILDFEFMSLTNQFSGQSDDQIKSNLGSMLGNPGRQLLWHFVFMTGTVGIVLGGLQDGIERWNKILMPALFIILAFLFVRCAFLPGFGDALRYLFSPDFSKLSAQSILEAVGQAFFTLSLGMGAMITYGSYLKKNENLVRTAATVAVMDTAIALIAGIVIFGIVFSYNLEPGGGPTLIFQTLPVLFSKMTGGWLLGVAFFLLVAFAAFTSAVSLLEVVVAYFVENKKMDRKKVTLITGAFIYGIGILAALSNNTLSDVKIFGKTFFDLFDALTANYFLPIGGIFISLFYGWVLGPKAINATLGKGAPAFAATGLLWVTRIFAPILVAAVIYNIIVA